MVFATVSTAYSIRDGAYIAMENASEYIYKNTHLIMNQTVDIDEPGSFEFHLYNKLRTKPSIDTQMNRGRPGWLIAPKAESLDLQYAAAICDREGNIIGRRCNCIYFQYFSEDGSKLGFAVVPLDELARNRESAATMDKLMSVNAWKQYKKLRFTGTMDGTYMTVQRIEGLYMDAENTPESQKWHTLITDYTDVPEDTQTVTLTTAYQNLGFIYNYKTDGGKYGNAFKYKSLCELIDKIIDYNIVNDRDLVFGSLELDKSVDAKYRQLFNPRTGEDDLYLVTVMSVEPLRAAMASLVFIYVITACFAVCFAILLWALIMKKLKASKLSVDK
jgi:hypothetical protein